MQLGTDREGQGWFSQNFKTVYTSSILVVASNKIKYLTDLAKIQGFSSEIRQKRNQAGNYLMTDTRPVLDISTRRNRREAGRRDQCAKTSARVELFRSSSASAEALGIPAR